jgi:2,5-diamino-6-(ribosylamino)-4(3H)-pyrimidinone 5'-phosphate reductase
MRTQTRPYVICHMCTTIDGKILGQRWARLPAGRDSSSLFETTAASFAVPAWLVGTTTMREFAARDVRLPVAVSALGRSDYIAQPDAGRFAIGADAKGLLRFRHSAVGGDHVVVLISRQVSNDYLFHLRSAGVSYLFCGRTHIDLSVALRKIRRRLGLRALMLEGGGIFNGAMLRARLIDEISQVIVPIVDGGAGVTALFEIPGKAPRAAAATLRLLSHRSLRGGIQWLRYRIAHPRPKQ